MQLLVQTYIHTHAHIEVLSLSLRHVRKHSEHTAIYIYTHKFLKEKTAEYTYPS